MSFWLLVFESFLLLKEDPKVYRKLKQTDI
jgi:hypothetical protein